jgi:hypothetical protein
MAGGRKVGERVRVVVGRRMGDAVGGGERRGWKGLLDGVVEVGSTLLVADMWAPHMCVVNSRDIANHLCKNAT